MSLSEGGQPRLDTMITILQRIVVVVCPVTLLEVPENVGFHQTDIAGGSARSGMSLPGNWLKNPVFPRFFPDRGMSSFMVG